MAHYREETDTGRRRFERYIGVDYSGAGTPTSSLKGLRVYAADREQPGTEAPPPEGPKKYWTRRGLAEWLVVQLSGDRPTIVGIDHGFSFPLEYFAHYRLAHDWSKFLDDFVQHWPTDADNVSVDFVRQGECGNAAARQGSARWRRQTERRTGAAKSLFHFDVPGQVAKSTHAGLPWLRYIRKDTGQKVHFWPFDGWQIPPAKSAIVEVYPRLWNWQPRPDELTEDQFDAITVADTLRAADADGRLAGWLAPPMSPALQSVALIEGWILGVDPSAVVKSSSGRRSSPGRVPAMPGPRELDATVLLAALDFAARKHRDQRRKDAEASPYVNHLIAVTKILASEGGVTEEPLLVAAVLHDTVEDTNTTFDELDVAFGSTVANLVREMTDDKSLAKDGRKRLQIEHAPHASPGARQLKIADKIANIRDIIDTPPTDWSAARKLEYFKWAEQVVAGCRGVNRKLDDVFDDVFAKAGAVVGNVLGEDA